MQPLEDLLHRIRWDQEFGKGRFALGYHDRVAGEQRSVRFESVTFDADRPGFFSIADAEGLRRHIPLHRVRTVYKDGVVIWARPERTDEAHQSQTSIYGRKRRDRNSTP